MNGKVYEGGAEKETRDGTEVTWAVSLVGKAVTGIEVVAGFSGGQRWFGLFEQVPGFLKWISARTGLRRKAARECRRFETGLSRGAKTD